MKLNSFFSILIVTILFSAALNAKSGYLDIDADHFESNKEKNYIYFKGNVTMVKNEDILKCQELFITTTTEQKKQIPKDYKASGNVSFSVHTNDNILKGKGDTVFYYPDDQKYIIIGDAYLEDTKEGKKLNAHKIYIDEKTGQTKIDGQKDKPVKFRIKLEGDK
ncbi:MAG: LptA/OstA family protein [Campylobacterota bacterium]|nr:LptA/OstA family protein [Campylobacterota bacterium]